MRCLGEIAMRNSQNTFVTFRNHPRTTEIWNIEWRLFESEVIPFLLPCPLSYQAWSDHAQAGRRPAVIFFLKEQEREGSQRFGAGNRCLYCPFWTRGPLDNTPTHRNPVAPWFWALKKLSSLFWSGSVVSNIGDNFLNIEVYTIPVIGIKPISFRPSYWENSAAANKSQIVIQ